MNAAAVINPQTVLRPVFHDKQMSSSHPTKLFSFYVIPAGMVLFV